MKAGQFLFLLRRFDEFDPKINVLSGSDKRKENELFVCNKHGLHEGAIFKTENGGTGERGNGGTGNL